MRKGIPFVDTRKGLECTEPFFMKKRNNLNIEGRKLLAPTIELVNSVSGKRFLFPAFLKVLISTLLSRNTKLRIYWVMILPVVLY